MAGSAVCSVTKAFALRVFGRVRPMLECVECGRAGGRGAEEGRKNIGRLDVCGRLDQIVATRDLSLAVIWGYLDLWHRSLPALCKLSVSHYSYWSIVLLV